MEPVAPNVRLVRRAYWLIRLRWIAILFVAAGTFVGSKVLDVKLHIYALYGIAVLLALYNTIVLLILNHLTNNNHEVSKQAVKTIINLQISTDLLILTILLHFSGGIENPFVFYFIFHMIIASILLSVRESYLQATFAILLFGLLVLLEYSQILHHHCLHGFVESCLHQDGLYVLGTYMAFATALYVAVYMATYIAIRLKRAEQAHREANVLLCEKDRMKDQYVLRLTHDIKGHLAAIQSCLDVVSNKLVGELNPQQDDFVGRANSRARKITHFVQMLLKLTRMRLSDEMEMSMFSLRIIIFGVIASIEDKAREKNITITHNIESQVDEIFGNRLYIEEAINSLILNAVRYTPEDGTIEITATGKDDCVMIEVIDTGIGIPQKDLPKIFDEFYRATNARNVAKDSTGLGLSIVKQVVQSHTGEIGVESSENSGSRFWFTIPQKPHTGK
jgi:signal transduction histidine kinase